jgi:hypothetical protein
MGNIYDTEIGIDAQKPALGSANKIILFAYIRCEGD